MSSTDLERSNVCKACENVILAYDVAVVCNSCSNQYHEDCWQEVGCCVDCQGKELIQSEQSIEAADKWSKVSDCLDFDTTTHMMTALQLAMLVAVFSGIQAFVTSYFWLFGAAMIILLACAIAYKGKSPKYLLDKQSRTVQFYERFYGSRKRRVLHSFDELECGVYSESGAGMGINFVSRLFSIDTNSYGIALKTKEDKYLVLTDDMTLKSADEICERLERVFGRTREKGQKAKKFGSIDGKRFNVSY